MGSGLPGTKKTKNLYDEQTASSHLFRVSAVTHGDGLIVVVDRHKGITIALRVQSTCFGSSVSYQSG